MKDTKNNKHVYTHKCEVVSASSSYRLIIVLNKRITLGALGFRISGQVETTWVWGMQVYDECRRVVYAGVWCMQVCGVCRCVVYVGV